MRYTILATIATLLFLTSCSTQQAVSVKKEFLFSIETAIPERSMAIAEIRREAYFILSKTKHAARVSFTHTKMDGNEFLVFENEPDIGDFSPEAINSTQNGFVMDFKVKRADSELSKLSTLKIINVAVKGSSIESAFSELIKTSIPKFTEKESYEFAKGRLLVVNVNKVAYEGNQVVLDFDISLEIEEIKALTERDRANFYGQLAISNIQKKQIDLASEQAQKGLGISKDCDKCLYARALLTQNYDVVRSTYFLEEAIKIESKKLIYYQMLQKNYIIMGNKTKAYEMEAFIMRNFQADGSVFTPQKAPIGKPIERISLPKIVTESFSNGVECSSINQKNLPIFHVSIGFNFGNSNAPEGKMGINKMMFDLLNEGADGKTSKEISEFIDKNGLYYWTTVVGDYSIVNCSSLTENGEQCIQLLKMIIQTPQFSDSEFKKLKKQEVEAYQLKTSQPDYLASRMLYRIVYGEHPYMYYDATLKTISGITLDDVKNYYNSFMIPKNSYIIINGDFDENLYSKLKEAFGSWSKEGTEVKYEGNRVKPQSKRDAVYFIHRPNSMQATIKYANITTAYTDDSFSPLSLGNEILGGGASSRLFMTLREKEGLTYGVYSGLSEKRESGIFIVSAQVRAEVTDKALASLFRELNLIVTDGVSEQELSDKKKTVAGEFAISLEKGSAINEELIKLKFFQKSEKDLENYFADLNKIKIGDVNSSIKSYIVPDNGVIVIVGDYDKIGKSLNFSVPVAVFDENFKPLKK
ncbi:insulinase family protein [bacterium]|nr:insulinase family protein [bacterium]